MVATADIHSPRYIQLFRESMERLNLKEEPCVFLLAGDIIDRGEKEQAGPVFDIISKKFPDTKIIAVFGNEEYSEIWEELRKAYPEVTWLSDECTAIDCGGRIAIVGTTGALERPTRWQALHIKNIKEVYEKRISNVEVLLREARKKANKVVLLSHYGLSKVTLRGERSSAYNWLYSSRMEQVIVKLRPDVAIHGHAHNGTKFAFLKGIPIYNVALPLNKEIVRVHFKTIFDYFR
ncbi:MAG: metallophosphoesterase [Caldisphaeraceae archaeon]|nr:metallophosphoesterase [Caldisphaeraceae archaeon]